MFRKLSSLALAAAALVLAACSDNTGVDLSAPLTVDFRSSAGHIHIWETAITYTALITANNQLVNDFDTLRVEYAAAGGNNWTPFGSLTLQAGGSYSGTTYFPVAGTYSIRLAGHRPGQSGIQEVYRPASTIAPVRQHYDVAGTTWRVEFESVPGLNKPGDTPTVNFYVMQATADAGGTRAPITGLNGVTVNCISPANATVTRSATENATTPGLYQATCAVSSNGWWKATVNLPGPSGSVSATASYGVGTIG
ncbi:MAG: hypothetical protein HY700_07455 [Gemmatimonadetes bacterium]|nr:hypothetical protein [Gemmatimonadota bacterium]